jgi:putative ABC transport system permease protein
MGASLVHKSNEIALPVSVFNPDDERMVTKIHEMMKEGQFLTGEDRGQILIGNYVAGNKDESKDFFESLGGVKTGDSITVNYVNGVSRDYRIKGIFQTKSYQTDYMVFVSWNEIEDVLGYPLDKSVEILVKTEPGTREDRVKKTMMSFGIKEDVKTWKEQAGGLFDESIESFQIINNITLLVSLIIAIVVLFIVIMIKTLHNRREIGVLKAIIGIIGIVIGFCIIQTLILYFSVYPIEFPDGNVSLYVESGIMIESAILLLIASVIAGYFPAMRIAKEDILTAMRG